MFNKNNINGYKSSLTGVKQKTLVYGEKTLMTEFLLEAGSQLPLHQHPHEQTGYLVKGRLHMVIGENEFIAEPGDSWCIGSNEYHGAEALDNSVAVEIFSPVREEYLP
ncbi:MAG: cupin domain-containing protein [Desulfobacteraceae bacterium]|nr:cupin domain-containing protein [Desulfobacteraceae bacterium]MBC2757116.1 cupin domain-containing protein [Desulfobacteraceae bacterium]